jgi:hypothetical protein
MTGAALSTVEGRARTRAAQQTIAQRPRQQSAAQPPPISPLCTRAKKRLCKPPDRSVHVTAEEAHRADAKRIWTAARAL